MNTKYALIGKLVIRADGTLGTVIHQYTTPYDKNNILYEIEWFDSNTPISGYFRLEVVSMMLRARNYRKKLDNG